MSSENVSLGDAPRYNGYDVLLIDDDKNLLEMTLLTLRGNGLNAVGYTEAVDAMTWAVTAEPVCIVVDLKMSGVSRLELVADLCALKRHWVIVLSGFLDVRTAVDAMRLGVDDILQKPVSMDELLETISRGKQSLNDVSAKTNLTFTRREQQVAELLVDGRTTKQIALQLSLSPRTVEFFRASLLRKTNSPNSAALASALTRIGISNK